MKDIVIACEDSFGLEVYSILKAINRSQAASGSYNILGYISDVPHLWEGLHLGVDYLGTIQDWRHKDGVSCVMGMKNPASKKRCAETLTEKGVPFETVIAPWSRIPAGLDIGYGSVIAAYTIHAGISIGKFVTLYHSMNAASAIGDYSTAMPFSNVISGTVGQGVYIGTHVFLRKHTKIGDHAYICDGSIVVGNVKQGQKVSGVPARRITE